MAGAAREARTIRDGQVSHDSQDKSGQLVWPGLLEQLGWSGGVDGGGGREGGEGGEGG